MFTELVYLDNTEKKLFTNRNLEYLIETVQYNNEDFLNKTDLYKNIYVDFRYLIKELIWVITVDSSNLDTTLQNDHNNITTYTTKYSNYEDTFDTLQIKLDNIEIVDEKAEYFRKIQSNFYHNKIYQKNIYILIHLLLILYYINHLVILIFLILKKVYFLLNLKIIN